MDRRSNRRRLHSRPDNGIYDRLILSGMDIPESVDTQKKAQENHSKMAETPVPSLILSLSVSTIFTMLIATSYNIVDTYFVSDLGESSVAAVGIMFSVMALIQAVARLVEERFPKLDGKVEINYIGTTIGSHTGPGTVALFFWGKRRQG